MWLASWLRIITSMHGMLLSHPVVFSYLCASAFQGPVSWRPTTVKWWQFHSPTVIPPLAFNKPSVMNCYHCRRRCSHTSPRRSPMMVTLHDTWFVKCWWWNDSWTVKTVVTWRSSASMIPAPDHPLCPQLLSWKATVTTTITMSCQLSCNDLWLDLCMHVCGFNSHMLGSS